MGTKIAKKFYKTRCVYCLQSFEELTSDHVFPRAWYPDTTPENLEKWQVPACSKCNSRYGKVERDLLQRLGLCLYPGESKSLGISVKAIRSINPSCAKSDKDQHHRRMRRDKILRELISPEKIPKESIFPNFGPWPSATPDEQIGVPVSHDKLQAFGEKLVRGISYVIDKRYIEVDHKIDIFFVHDKNAQEIIAIIKRFGKEYHRGSGIRIGVVFASELFSPDDPQNGLFAIDIWGKLRMYASVLPASQQVF